MGARHSGKMVISSFGCGKAPRKTWLLENFGSILKSWNCLWWVSKSCFLVIFHLAVWNFLGVSLKFRNQCLAVSQSHEFTILYPELDMQKQNMWTRPRYLYDPLYIICILPNNTCSSSNCKISKASYCRFIYKRQTKCAHSFKGLYYWGAAW